MRLVPLAVLASVLILVGGELYFRLPWVYPPLRYSSDTELGHVFETDQNASLWLANFSVPSPRIRINNNGHRGPDFDWDQPSLVSIGSSEVLGSGVRDTEAWPNALSGMLQRDGSGTVVVNAGCTGYGPYHQSIRLGRLAAMPKVRGAIVRVATGDMHFLPHTPGTIGVSRKRIESLVRDYSVFARFLVNKAQAQVYSLQRTLRPSFLAGPTVAIDRLDRQRRFWDENRRYWVEMAAIAAEREIELVFLLIDPTGRDEYEIAQKFQEEFGDEPAVSVLYLDKAAFGMTGIPEERVDEIVRSSLTLGYDPHANARQHEFVADRLHDFLGQGR